MEHENAVTRLAVTLEKPQQEYRPLPFWSWNDALQPDELRRQIALMKKSGVGGYFMHARGGLQTEYLEQPWFDSVAVGIKAGEEHDLEPWIYDEEGWPSGFAGGKVTALGDWVYARGLRLRRIAKPSEAVQGESLLGVFACTANDAEVVPIHRMEQTTNYTSYVEMTHSCSPFYIDVMNEKAVRAFLDCTHEEYANRFTLDNAKGLRGFFTDEPRFSEGPIPWSYLLPAEFTARYDYDLLEKLPALYLPCQGYRKVRHQFWAMVNDLFVNAYMRQMGEWCAQHNCKLTGHMMMEESLYSQMTGTGGGMPFYEFMQQPGVDSLRRAVNDPRIPKQVSSVAEQLGKKQVISESYAMCGWDLNFDEMRWIAGWQYVNGVNRICQHLQAYSLKGVRKRDYPPSLSYQQTWYDEYHRFNDYLARLGQMLSGGKKCIDVLLLHPMHSGWVSYDGTNNEEIKQLDADFVKATLLLSGGHADYHLGDETILRRHARVLCDGRVQVGDYTYSVIAIPSAVSVDATTVSLLTQFAAAGHPLLALGQWPLLCEGEPCEQLQELGRQAVAVSSLEDLSCALHGTQMQTISICEKGKQAQAIHCCQVKLETGGIALYMVNMDAETGHSVEIALPGNVNVCSLALDTLEKSKLATKQSKEKTTCNVSFLPKQSVVLIYENGIVDTAKEQAPIVRLHTDAENWRITNLDDNMLTLDACTYQIDGGAWQPKKAVIHLMQELMDLRRSCEICQRFVFTMQCDPLTLHRLAFVMEQPQQFAVTINGHPISFDSANWHKDISFCKTDILPYVLQGENVVEIAARFSQNQHVYDVLYGENVYETELNKLTYDMELESVYLLGDFGVYSQSGYKEGARNSLCTDGPFVLDTAPKQFTHGCFTTQGLAFFAGKLTVEKELIVPPNAGKVELDIGCPRAGLVQIQINGKMAGTFLWAPYCCDITSLVQTGTNTVAITLFASNRNLLGPHHHTKGETYSVGPISFTGKFSWAERESEAVEITPEMRLQQFWQETYSFVTFGLF